MIKFSSQVAVVAALLLAPAAMAATTRVGVEDFCTSFPTIGPKYQTNAYNQVNNVRERIANEAQKVQVNRQSIDAVLQKKRAKWLQNRQAIYAKLNDQAATAAEKQAVTIFQNAIETAVTVREEAVDSARVTYRQGLDQLLSQHQRIAQQVIIDFQSAVQAAIIHATDQCSAGTVPATVRTTFKSALKKAKAKRAADVKQEDEIAAQLQQLAQTRNASVQQAMQAYQTARQIATSTLKATFDSTANSSGSTNMLSPSPSATPGQ